MTTELETLPDGAVKLKVCEDGICAVGFVSSHHLVQPKEAQLQQFIRAASADAYQQE